MKTRGLKVESVVPTLSSEEQLRRLREYLATSRSFSECRGKLGRGWGDIGVLDDERFTTPTSIEEECKRRGGQLRILVNKLAKLRKGGQMFAYEELFSALCDDRFIITGEDSPLHKREIGTLVMFDPERTIKLMRWLKLLHPKIIERHLGHSNPSGEWVFERGGLIDRPDLKCLTDEVLSEWPTIREGLEKFYSKKPGGHWSACREYLPQLLLPEGYESQEWFIKDGRWLDLSFNEYLCGWLNPVGPDTCSDIGEYLQKWSCGVFFPKKEQDEVLSMFQRDKQERTATWRLSFPAHIATASSDLYSCSFGLFPENELDRFQRQWPAYTSGSRQGGMGAVVLESRRSVPMVDTLFEVKAYRQAKETPNVQDVGIQLFLRGL